MKKPVTLRPRHQRTRAEVNRDYEKNTAECRNGQPMANYFFKFGDEA